VGPGEACQFSQLPCGTWQRARWSRDASSKPSCCMLGFSRWDDCLLVLCFARGISNDSLIRTLGVGCSVTNACAEASRRCDSRLDRISRIHFLYASIVQKVWLKFTQSQVTCYPLCTRHRRRPLQCTGCWHQANTATTDVVNYPLRCPNRPKQCCSCHGRF
jgi:hypothetical protein